MSSARFKISPARLRSALRRAHLAAIAGLALLLGAPAALAQEFANSNAAFWLQERERMQHHARPAPAARQATRVRRLVPNKRLARPTIWRGTPEHTPEAPGAPVERDPAENTPAMAAPVPAPADMTPATAPPTQPAEAAPASSDTQKADAAPSPPTGPAPLPTPLPTPSPTPFPPPVSPVAAAVTVAVVGDNVGFMLGQGLTDAAIESGGAFAVVRKTRDSSGLVREDFYDWQKNLRDILAGPEKYAAIAIMIGSNDRQELRDSAGRYDVLTPRWRELYTARVAALAALLKERKIPFFWVGLPIMRAERYSSEIAQLNEIYRAQAEAAGGRYVDIWDAFADENGHYSVFGPDVNGQTVKLRTSDGIHFTRVGARKLAYFAEQAMRALLEPPKDAPVAALPPALASPVPPVRQPGATIGALPAQPTPEPVVPLPAPPPPRPAFGPIQPLTAPPVAPGGELAGPAGGARATQARANLAPALAEGRPPAARPGRADDFAWPHK